MFKHLLVPTDGSQLSEETIRRAASFAKEAGARITFFYAKPELPTFLQNEGVLVEALSGEQLAKAAEDHAQRILGFVDSVCEEAGVTYSKLCSSNDTPSHGIIAAATDNGCDLIFMASHGRRGISSLLLGGETQKVLTQTKIPVLVYR